MALFDNRAFKVVLTLLLAGCAVRAVCSTSLYTEALVDAFFAFALASVLILHLRVRPRWRDAAMVLAGVALFGALDFRILHFTPNTMAWLSFTGVSSFLVMAIEAVWARDRSARKGLLYALIPAFLFVASDYFASTMLAWTGAAHPKTLDLYLLSFDYSLRIQCVFAAGQIFVRDHFLHAVGLLVYLGLALPISIVYGGRLVRYQEKAFPVMLAFLITGPVGILFYNLFPACGPLSLFKEGFPFVPFPPLDAPRLFLEPVTIAGARNAMPSLHMAWMLLAWWYSRGLSWLERLIVFIFLAFTAFATLGTGEHWLVDLIVAFPFALMIEGACAYSVPLKKSPRLRAICFGLLATLGWLILLRYAPKFFWISPVLPWGIAAATIATTVFLQAGLGRIVDLTDRSDQRAAQTVPAPVLGAAVPAK
jgi:hypothetical protein